MSSKTCDVEGCEKPHHARGWCDSHYRWSRDNGWAEPNYPLPVVIDGIRMRRLDGGFVYGYGSRQQPPVPR